MDLLTQIADTNPRTVLQGVRVLDVRQGVLGGMVNVVIENGNFVDIDAGAHTSGANVIDGEGLTLMPGYIDCHAHILSHFLSTQGGIWPWMLKQMERNLYTALSGGLIAVCDMLSPIKVMNRVRRKVAAGKVPGPDILACGPILSCRGGYPDFINPIPFPFSAVSGQPKLHVDRPEQAEKFIRYLKTQGIDHVKVGYTSQDNRLTDPPTPMPVISEEIFQAICDAAHNNGLHRIAVHHYWTPDLPVLLRVGVTSLEHAIYDRVLTDDEIAAIKASGKVTVPTLTVTDNMARMEERLAFYTSDRARDYFEEPSRQFLIRIASYWTDMSKNGREYATFGAWRGNRLHYSYALENTRKLIAAGAPICAGTDLGACTTNCGEIVDEIIRLNRAAGMTTLQAIQSATIDAARLIGRSDSIGSVETGKHADAILVAGNPLEDIYSVRRVRYISKSGRLYKNKYPELPDFYPGYSIC